MLAQLLISTVLSFAPPREPAEHPAVQRLREANELANEHSDEAIRALSMALQGFLVNAEVFVDDAGALELRTLTQLNLVRALLAGGQLEQANDAMDEAIRSALGRPIPAHRLGPVVADLYMDRATALRAAGTGEIDVRCTRACIVLINERTVTPTRATGLPLGTYRVHAIRQDFGQKLRTEATLDHADQVAVVNVAPDFGAAEAPSQAPTLAWQEYIDGLSSAIELARVAPEDGIAPLLLLLVDAPKYTVQLAANAEHRQLRLRALLVLAMAYLAVADRDSATFAIDEAIRSSFDGNVLPTDDLSDATLKLLQERQQTLAAGGTARLFIDCPGDCQVFVNEAHVGPGVELLPGNYRVHAQVGEQSFDAVIEIDCAECQVRRIFRNGVLYEPARSRAPLQGRERIHVSPFERPGLAAAGFAFIGVGGGIAGIGTIACGIAYVADLSYGSKKCLAGTIAGGLGVLLLGTIMSVAGRGIESRKRSPGRRQRHGLRLAPPASGYMLTWRF